MLMCVCKIHLVEKNSSLTVAEQRIETFLLQFLLQCVSCILKNFASQKQIRPKCFSFASSLFFVSLFHALGSRKLCVEQRTFRLETAFPSILLTSPYIQGLSLQAQQICCVYNSRILCRLSRSFNQHFEFVGFV